MDVFEVFKKLSRMRDQALIFALVVATAVIAALYNEIKHVPDEKMSAQERMIWGIVCAGFVLGFALLVFFVHTRFSYKASALEKELARLKQAELDLAELRTSAGVLEDSLRGRTRELEEALRSSGRLLTPAAYHEVLEEWNRDGPGTVLLYNVELQSFQTSELIEKTWGKVASWEGIAAIQLLLPSEKVQRWERVVRDEWPRFFRRVENRKFFVSEIPRAKDAMEQRHVLSIGFALFRRHDPDGTFHPRTVFFVLSQPFSSPQAAVRDGDSEWWSYNQVLAFDDNPSLRGAAMQIWNQEFNEVRDVERVWEDTKTLEPIGPELMLDRLRIANPRARDAYLRHLAPRTVRSAFPESITPSTGHGRFAVSYTNGDQVVGSFAGIVPGVRRQAMVWVGGFTEKSNTRLSSLFEGLLKSDDVAQFYYEVSSAPSDTTLERLEQDMCAVLDYVSSQQEAVRGNRIVLVARSINAHIAARVASRDAYSRLLAGIVLVAPVFDVIEMMDNYRMRDGSKTREPVRVESFWRGRRGYSDAGAWEDERRGWLEFFGEHVKLPLLLDLVRNERDEYSLDRFVECVGRISQKVPVFLLSNRDDPITRSQDGLAMLERASGGSGHVSSDNFTFVPISSTHLREVQKLQYPFALRSEAQEVRAALRKILGRLDLPLVGDQPRESSAPLERMVTLRPPSGSTAASSG